MVRECPKCHLINPPTAVHCDCGYEFETGRVVRQGQPRRELGLFQSLWVARLGAVGLFIALVGVVLLMMELTGKEPDGWGVVRSIGIIAVAGCLLAYATWRSNRSA